MNIRYSVGSGTLIAALLTSTASFADVSPQDVWDNWRGYMESYGYEISADENMSGGVLTVSGLSLSMDLPEDGGMASVSMGEMSFTDQGNGTVAVGLPPVMPLNVQIAPTDEDVVDMVINYTLTDFSMTASGTPENMTYDFTSSELGVALASLVVDGEAQDNATAVMSLSDVAGKMVTTTGNIRSIVETITASGLSYDVAVSDPDGDGSFEMDGQADGINMTASISIPEGIDMNDMNAALKAGLSIEMAVEFGAGATKFAFSDDGSNASGNSMSTGSSMTVEMDENHMRYGVSAEGYQVSLVGSDIPLPINVAMDELALDFSMPVAKSDTPDDFSALLKLVNFAPDALIWGLADPTGALPHDPATLILDMTGKANWLFDIMDPEQAEMMDSEIPGQIHALTLKNLTLKAAGAELTGTGDFTFDNDDLETFDGIPAPEGSIDLKLVGGNGLIDNLITMGIMAEEEAMGARMMMGLFGRPGDGDDVTLSTIEVKSNGEITANGQRLQ